jgi:hypothetical protein
MWFRGHRNGNLRWSDLDLSKLQNELKFIKIELQKAKIALRAGKISIMCIMKRPKSSILEKV